ncbi:MAG: hypothetical protein ACLGPL_10655 [Acidobacteriota bacterium]
MRRMQWLCAVLIALLWAGSASAMTRGVFVNGKVHFCYLYSNILCYKAYTVDSKGMLNPKYTSDYEDADKTYDYHHNRYGKGNGTGIAVFNNQIIYTFTAQQDTTSTADIWPYVAVFDLTKNDFVSVTRLGNKALHSDNKAGGRDAGAAVAVLNNIIYVFTDTNTFTSADGVTWASHPPLITDASGKPLIDYQIEDAIAIFPPDSDPKLLLLLGYSDVGSGCYTRLTSVTWNGKFDAASDYSPTVAQTDLGLGSIVLYTAGLHAGTAQSPDHDHFSDGAKAASVQLYVAFDNSEGETDVRRMEYTYQTSPGKWTIDSKHLHASDGGDIPTLVAFPWYTDECSSDGKRRIQRQHISVNTHECTKYGAVMGCKEYSWKARSFLSDAMVPQKNPNANNLPDNQGWVEISCNDWGGTYTNTDAKSNTEEDAKLRQYWQLLGVVMGAPPFAVNGVSGTEVGELSNVSYGTDDDNQVTHEQEWENVLTFSAGFEVKAGLLDDLLGIEDQFDVGYKHGWLTEHEDTSKWTERFNIKMGTSNIFSEDIEELDLFGWGIFSIPTIRVQDFALYSYDYDLNSTTQTGTYLQQDLHSTQVLDGSTIQQIAFDLSNPGGPKDEIPGLFAGMPGLAGIGMPGRFPLSTDLRSWNAVDWQNGNGLWSVKFGNPSPQNNVLKFGPGSNSEFEFTKTEDHVDTSGKTNSVEVKNTLGFSAETGLGGFKASLTAGYDGSFGTKVTNSTSFSSQVQASLGMKPCTDASCYKSVTVQPYWLEATNPKAPWIPANYNGQFPWCMTWRVTSACTNDNNCVGVSSSAPDQVLGTVVGASDASRPTLRAGVFQSEYHVRGGRMSWVDENGRIKFIPMKASGFDPALGVTIALNSFKWSSARAEGSWTRHRNTWVFKSSDTVRRNVITLKLNFENHTWDFDIAKADLSDELKASSQGSAQIKLMVNNRFGFVTSVQHNVRMAWEERFPRQETGTMELIHYKGEYDSCLGTGKAILKGTIPADLNYFGDMSIEVNGHKRVMPLISMEYFDDAVEHGKTLTYEAKGVRLIVNFGEKTWWARFTGDALNRLHTPERGNARICVRMGGVPLYNSEIPIFNHTTNLEFYGKGFQP